MVNKARNILITGGTGKIGAVLVEKMILDGHNVVFTTTTSENGENLISKINPFLNNQELKYLILDLEKQDSFEEKISGLPIKIDTVIHNARSLDSLKIGGNGITTSQNFLKEFEIAVVAPYLLNYSLISYNHPLNDIIYIASIYASVAPNKSLYDNFDEQSPIQYGVSKAAQIHSVKELAVRFSDKGIKVNAISYGGVEGRASQDFIERYNKLNPSGKMLNEDDLYPPVQFLLNNKGLNITGENIKIDGGWTIW